MPKWFVGVISALLAGLAGLAGGALSYQATVQETIQQGIDGGIRQEIDKLESNFELEMQQWQEENQDAINKLTAEHENDVKKITGLQVQLNESDKEIIRLNTEQKTGEDSYAISVDKLQQVISELRTELDELNREISALRINSQQNLPELDIWAVPDVQLKVLGSLDPLEFRAMGLMKLNMNELVNLDEWVDLLLMNVIAYSQQMSEDFNLNLILGAEIVAEDGQPLGIITLDQFDSRSIMNPRSDFGSQAGRMSIFNQLGNYGGRLSLLSPYSGVTTTPPKIFKNGAFITYLTINPRISPRLDPYFLMGWLNSIKR